MLRKISAAAALVVCTATGSSAATLDFKFSFTNLFNGSTVATVTGVIRGLTDNGSSAASSVEILTNGDGFGVGEFVGSPIENSFSVTAGQITGVQFVSYGRRNTAPAVTDASFRMTGNCRGSATICAGLTDDPNVSTVGNPAQVTFEAIVPVPLPAGGILLLTGFTGLAALRRRKSRLA